MWLGSYRYPHQGIETVEKITNTQIVMDSGFNQRYRRASGDRIGGLWDSPAIHSVATPEECAAWDQEQLEKRTAREACDRERTERNAKRKGLADLFQVSVYISDADYGNESRRSGKFDVQFLDLTEAEVRELAEKMKGGE